MKILFSKFTVIIVLLFTALIFGIMPLATPSLMLVSNDVYAYSKNDECSPHRNEGSSIFWHIECHPKEKKD